MSTKCTIAHGKQFHLYADSFDEDHIHLEIQDTQFEAGNNRVMVAIPVAMWEVIRRHTNLDLSFADQTDQALREYVEQAVDDRIKEFASTGDRAKPIAAMSGLLAYGAVDEPKDAQVKRGVEYFKNVRERQRKIRLEIADLQRAAKRAE